MRQGKENATEKFSCVKKGKTADKVSRLKKKRRLLTRCRASKYI